MRSKITYSIAGYRGTKPSCFGRTRLRTRVPNPVVSIFLEFVLGYQTQPDCFRCNTRVRTRAPNLVVSATLEHVHGCPQTVLPYNTGPPVNSFLPGGGGGGGGSFDLPTVFSLFRRRFWRYVGDIFSFFVWFLRGRQSVGWLENLFGRFPVVEVRFSRREKKGRVCCRALLGSDFFLTIWIAALPAISQPLEKCTYVCMHVTWV